MDAIKTILSEGTAPQAGDNSILPEGLAPVHVSRLDADNYNADDLDGVTEGLLGSGNLNYLMLQSRQTDAALAGGGFESGGNGGSGAGAAGVSAALSGSRFMADGDAAGSSSQDAGAFGGDAGAQGGGGQDYFNGGRLGAFSQGLSGAGGGVTGAIDGRDGGGIPRDGGDGTGGGLPGGNGANGTDGAPGDGTTLIENVTNVVNNTIDDTSTLLQTLIDDTTSIVNNTVNNAGDVLGDITNSVTNITEIIDNILHPPGTDVDLFAHNDLGAPQVDLNLDPLEAIVGEIDVGIGFGHDADNATLELGAIVAGIPLVEGISIPLPLPAGAGAAVDDLLAGIPAPEELLADPLATVNALAEDLVADPFGAVEGLVGGILAPAPGGDDSDLSLTGDTGLPPLAVNLDAIEDLVGDIDLGLDLSQAANGLDLGLNALVADMPLANTVIPVGAELPDIEGLLADPASALENLAGGILAPAPGGSDTDLSLTGDTGLPPLAVNLDVIEGIAGDIDIGADLSQAANGLDLGLNALVADTQLVDTVIPVHAELPDIEGLLADPAAGLEDIAGGILDAPQPQPGADTDLVLTGNTGLPPLDVNLDALENITGDIDLGLDATDGPEGLDLGLNALVADTQLADTVISVHAAGLPVITEVGDNGAGGNLADVAGDVADSLLPDGLGDSILAEAGGTMEQISGAIALLPQASAPDGLAATSASDGFAWPQVADSGVSSAVADTIGDLIGHTSEAAGVLAAPSGSVSEGLGLLDLGGDHGLGLSGLNLGHHGGLFG